MQKFTFAYLSLGKWPVPFATVIDLRVKVFQNLIPNFMDFYVKELFSSQPTLTQH